MYHIHIVDGSGGSARVNAATLFAHLTLRCGHWRDATAAATTTAAEPQTSSSAAAVVVVSASSVRELVETTAATAGDVQPPSQPYAQYDAADARDEAAHDNDEVRLVKAMEAAVRSGYTDDTTAPTARDGNNEHKTTLPFAATAAVPHIVAPYVFFDTSFATAERSLALACARQDADSVHGLLQDNSSNSNTDNTAAAAVSLRYFDLIFAADTTAYDAVLQYYTNNATGMQQHCDEDDEDGSDTDSANDERIASQYTRHNRHPLAVAHIVCADVTRVGALYQRLAELLLGLGSDAAEQRTRATMSDAHAAAAATCAYPSWMASVDDVVASFAQVLGVDVLVTVV